MSGHRKKEGEDINININTGAWYQRFFSNPLWIIVVIAIIILLVKGGIDVVKKKGWFKNEDGKVVATISQGNLEKVLKISELSTIEYTYNAICRVYTDDASELKYYVAYEGIIKAGIDFDKIVVEVDEKSKIVTILLPEIEIQDVIVDVGSLDYIFEDSDYETETVSAEAYGKCLEDLRKKASEEKQLIDLAVENSKAAVEGLLSPWIKQIDEEYIIIFK